jgi:acyl dehydratase/NAD(P)-dependent dehydrogenase (short-subunit alcohol dehydrogenase family)
MSRFAISSDDSKAFAGLSGDLNPLHIDPTLARRLIFGSTVPHGVHVLLSGLDTVFAKAEAALRMQSLRVAFLAPAKHHEPLTAKCTENEAGLVQIAIFQDNIQLQNITLQVAEKDDSAADVDIPDVSPPDGKPLELDFPDMIERSGNLALTIDRKLLRTLFPTLARLLPAQQTAVLLACTRLVGMECPGLRSIFADLAVTFDRAEVSETPNLRFRTDRADRRTSSVHLQFQATRARGEITALVRPEPVMQASAASLASQVMKDEFASQQALVIGGSRGLGEATAKLLAMGGADVVITFARGRDDAIAVSQDITNNGGRCSPIHFDVGNPPHVLTEEWPHTNFRPTHVYFFATPAIQIAKLRSFSDSRFRHYCDYYVSGLARSLSAIDRLFSLGKAPLNLFYPSTIFIDELRPGTTEYAAAKAAGEVVCRMLERTRPGLRVACPRLPVLRTDQTSTLRGGGAAADPVPVLLKGLREIA